MWENEALWLVRHWKRFTHGHRNRNLVYSSIRECPPSFYTMWNEAGDSQFSQHARRLSRTRRWLIASYCKQAMYMYQSADYKVTIKVSKIDPFCQGVDIFIGRTTSELCPVAAVLSYLTRVAQNTTPEYNDKGWFSAVIISMVLTVNAEIFVGD